MDPNGAGHRIGLASISLGSHGRGVLVLLRPRGTDAVFEEDRARLTTGLQVRSYLCSRNKNSSSNDSAESAQEEDEEDLHIQASQIFQVFENERIL